MQGLRALAILLVVAFHAGLGPRGGFVGVDVFFVISGFVICRMFLRRHTMSLGQFYGSRARRLLPALGLMLLAVLPLSFWLESPIEAQGDTAFNAVGAAFSVANLALYITTAGYFDDTGHSILLHTWSLGVEEQFYLVFPLLAVLCLSPRGRRRSRSGARKLALWLWVVFALSMAANLWLCFGPSGLPAPVAIAFFAPVTRAWEFAVGALLAVGLRRRSDREQTAGARIAGVLGVLVLAVSAFAIHEQMIFPGYVAVLPVVGTALLILHVVAADGPVRRFLEHPVALWIGDRSYGWYLWHWPLIAFSVLLWGRDVWIQSAAALLSLPVAALSFRYVEEPIRSRRRLARWPSSALAAALILPVLVGSAGLHAAAGAARNEPGIKSIAEQVTPNAAEELCSRREVVGPAGFSACVRYGRSDHRPIVLVGDSNAGQYADGLLDVAEQLDRTLLIATATGCSVVDLDVYVRGGDTRCSVYARRVLDWLRTEEPSTVVVSSAGELVDGPAFGLARPGSVPAFDPETKAAMWTEALTSTLQEIRRSGHVVVQLGAVPHFLVDGLAWRVSRCNGILLRTRPEECSISMSRSQALERQTMGLAAEEAAAAAADIVHVPMIDVVCGAVCSVREGNFWIYREGMHLSVGMSRRLAPFLSTTVRRAETALAEHPASARPASRLDD